MGEFNKISRYSSLPIVDLNNIGIPQDGISVQLTDSCYNYFTKGDKCRQHYEKIASVIGEKDTLIQCPYGFATAPFRVGIFAAALTGFIPHPRLGGGNERVVVKRHKEAIATVEAIRSNIVALRDASLRFDRIKESEAQRLRLLERDIAARLQELDVETAKKHSMALHEIRKLNRTIVQTAERICINQSPNAPEQADSAIVNIWKTAELMSKQFDIVEILANESLTELPLKTLSQVYRIFDKCVRVFQSVRGPRSLFLQAPKDYSPKVVVCEKTFPIIPTVLISNALKYSKPGSEVRVFIEPSGSNCVASVISISDGEELLDDSIFNRGVRLSTDSDGSGNGLYVAQLVAKQHSTKITIESIPNSSGTVKHVFKVHFRTISW